MPDMSPTISLKAFSTASFHNAIGEFSLFTLTKKSCSKLPELPQDYVLSRESKQATPKKYCSKPPGLSHDCALSGESKQATPST